MDNEINKDDMNPQAIYNLNDDFSLIRQFNSGNEKAFKELVNRHKEKVRNLIYLTLGNTDAVDDISQEVFISVYKKLKFFRFESQFSTWLYRITVNKCRDHLRKVKLRNLFFPALTPENENHSKTYLRENYDIKEIVRMYVAKLPEKMRVPLVLRDFEGLSYQEIAEALELDLGTVKSRIFRAREGLRKFLEPFQEELL
ncbi:MAG: sigma-70 family RNA polymerase sigma factor [Ignavibacteriaceae bacterium]|nr:sigma-70 family RNA polymerase sigma factor [Ignavibacteriaceae bacterium]NUM70831.1 sigma-70 family RNA polymerase sigma factor [Ignavibacteriaceae bacterium]